MSFGSSTPYRFAFALAMGATCVMAPGTSKAQVLDDLLPENKIVPGAACTPTNTNAIGNFERRASGMRNLSTSDQWVTCSLVTDSEGTWNSWSVPLLIDGHADVHVGLDYSSVTTAATTTCVAQVVSDGAIAESVSGSITSSATNPTVTLTVEGLTLGNAESSPAAVSCLLPPGAKLNSVRLEETTITDLNTAPIL